MLVRSFNYLLQRNQTLSVGVVREAVVLGSSPRVHQVRDGSGLAAPSKRQDAVPSSPRQQGIGTLASPIASLAEDGHGGSSGDVLSAVRDLHDVIKAPCES